MMSSNRHPVNRTAIVGVAPPTDGPTKPSFAPPFQVRPLNTHAVNSICDDVVIWKNVCTDGETALVNSIFSKVDPPVIVHFTAAAAPSKIAGASALGPRTIRPAIVAVAQVYVPAATMQVSPPALLARNLAKVAQGVDSDPLPVVSLPVVAM